MVFVECYHSWDQYDKHGQHVCFVFSLTVLQLSWLNKYDPLIQIESTPTRGVFVVWSKFKKSENYKLEFRANEQKISKICNFLQKDMCTHFKHGVANHIMDSVQHDLPTTTKLRRLFAKEDYDSGYLTVLSQLTNVGDISKQQFVDQMEILQNLKDTYHFVVLHDTNLNKIVGCATLVVEQKFAHECSCIGHIEDVVVLNTYRGKGFGKSLINCLTQFAQHFGCYKCILDCDESKVEFYTRSDYKEHGRHMVKYFDL